MNSFKCLVIFAVIICGVCSQQDKDPLTNGLRMFRRIYDNCEKSEEIVKCLKLQAVKIVDRAMRADNIAVFDGLTVVRRKDVEGGRSFNHYKETSDNEARSMTSDQLDNVLAEKTSRFFDSHQVKMSIADFMSQSNARNFGTMVEEGRGKLKKYIGPILTAVAIKGGFVAMAFQAIALIAAKALLIGKIALVLSAIIGLKKLVSGGEAHEKTTYEIVNHPQLSQSHSYSSSHFGGEYDGAAGRESFAQDRAFKAYAPKRS